jgi:hypothetical protein
LNFVSAFLKRALTMPNDPTYYPLQTSRNHRWLERHGVPQTYCQVFFDSVFAINFLDIFATIAAGDGYSIETPAKSQEKATIMIPITRGARIGKATSLPTFAAEHRVTELGRHDAYVVPQGGGFELDAAAIKKVLLPEG